MELKRFLGNVAIITGSATGIGEACALRFAHEGAHVICVDWNREENEKTAKKCREYGVDAISIIKDVQLPDGAAEVVLEVENKY